MKQYARRNFLKSISAALVAGIAGCSSGNGTENENDDGGNTPSTPPIEQYLNISEIEWVSYYLRFSVENVSDTDIDFVQVESAVYNGETRIGTMYTNIGELAAGTNVNAEIDYTVADVDGSLCDGTRYTISPNANVGSESYEQTYEHTNPPVCGQESTTSP